MSNTIDASGCLACCCSVTTTALGTAAASSVGVNTLSCTIPAISVNGGQLLVGVIGVRATNLVGGTLNITWNGTNMNVAVPATVQPTTDNPSQQTVGAIFYYTNGSFTASGNVVFSNTLSSGSTLGSISVLGTLYRLNLLNAVTFDFGVENASIGTSTTPDSGTISMNHACEIAIGGLVTDGPASDSAGSPTNGFTAGQRIGIADALGVGATTLQDSWKKLPSITTTSAGWTGITSRDWIAMAASFY